MWLMIRILKNLSTKFSHMVNRLQNHVIFYSRFSSQTGVKNCYLCNERTNKNRYFCDECNQDLPKLNTKCWSCCLPMVLETQASVTDTLLCGECISKPPSFSRTFCVFKYEFPINTLIRQIKYSSERYWLNPITSTLISEIITSTQGIKPYPLPDLLTPIPIHKSKKKIRGYNQAELIAKKLSKKLGIPTANNILIKTKNTETQAQLNKQQRLINLKGSLAITTKKSQFDLIKGRHIALIDDVMTTKATCELASKLLLDSGASRVDVWCLARTPKENSRTSNNQS